MKQAHFPIPGEAAFFGEVLVTDICLK